MATCPLCGERFEDAQFCPTDGAKLEEDAPSPRIGQVIDGRYRILAKLGEGGVGEIFAAQHLYLDKRVALKLLRPAFAADPEAVKRLEREARSASAIGHPNIVRVEDFGRGEEQAYLAMELLEGESLEAYLERGGDDAATSFEVIAQVCDGLAAAHAAGVIHRDLKPANIVLTRADHGGYVAKVLDFGIAKLATGDANLTRTGTLVGTPYYMAPEQALGAPVDQRADVYAIGVILYQLVTGAVPFWADSFIAILHKHTSVPPTPPSERCPDGGITAEVDALILQCLAKNPDERIQDMAVLGAELRRLAGGGLDLRMPSAGDATPRRRPGLSSPSSSPSAPSPQPRVGSVSPRPAAAVTSPTARRRGRLPVAIAAAVVLVAGALVARSMARDEPLAAVADASAEQAPPDAAHAGISDAGAPRDRASERERFEFEGEVDALAFAVAISPPVPQPRSRLDVELEIEPRDDELARAIARGEVEARFHFEYYRDHRVVAEVARDVSAEGAVRGILSLPDPGKYHVEVVLRAAGEDVAEVRFDLCVGAELGTPEARELCPQMNVP
jgi:eukaryotic-like serine/threonine-protein kinase